MTSAAYTFVTYTCPDIHTLEFCVNQYPNELVEIHYFQWSPLILITIKAVYMNNIQRCFACCIVRRHSRGSSDHSIQLFVVGLYLIQYTCTTSAYSCQRSPHSSTISKTFKWFNCYKSPELKVMSTSERTSGVKVNPVRETPFTKQLQTPPPSQPQSSKAIPSSSTRSFPRS